MTSKKGSILLNLIIVMSLMAALGLGIFYVNTTSTFSQIGANDFNKAQYLAESGMRYALQKLRNRSLNDTEGTDYTLSSTTNGKFNLKVERVSGKIEITSTGISKPGTPFEARKMITIEIGADIAAALAKAPFSFAGEGGAGMAALAEPIKGVLGEESKSGVTVDTVNKKIDFGFDPETGKGLVNTAGCVWYQGWADSNGSDCVKGRCNFNKGIRAYFDIEYTDWEADGFTFAIISAHNNGTEEAPVYINEVTDCGGGSCGEFMGYAGPGSKTSGHGLQPPKIAIEFDPYIPDCPDNGRLNDCGTEACMNNCDDYSWGCNCRNNCLDNCSICECNSRYDRSFISATEPKRHVSLMYWGTNTTDPCGSTTEGKYTYDNNRHGRGDGTTNPRNPLGTDTGDTKGFMRINFNDATYAGKLSFRVELDRLNDGTYKLYGWVKKYSESGYTDADGVKFNDTSQRYNKSNDSSQLPNFKQQVLFSADWHNKFDRMIFGWTQGTGGLTQKVTIKNFQIDFKNINDF